MDWEDEHHEEEDEFVYQPHPTLDFVLQKEGQYECSTLVVAESGPAALFVHSLIGKESMVNRVNFSKAKQSSLADVYLDSTKTGYLVFNDDLPPMREIFLMKFLEVKVKFERILMLKSVARSTLRDINCPPMTCIATSDASEKLTLPRFGEGITGIWAQTVAWGELNSRPVICFIATMKEYELTSEIVNEAFGMLRGKYGLKDDNLQIGDRVKKYNIKKASSKMYL